MLFDDEEKYANFCEAMHALGDLCEDNKELAIVLATIKMFYKVRREQQEKEREQLKPLLKLVHRKE